MKGLAVAAILAGALGILVPAQRAQAQVSVSVTIGGFYDELSPYGDWVDCSYGECWAPRGVDAGWQPYSNGEWIYTRYGWTWMSNDPWGGDPYHYGTWAFVSRHGWVWVPGTVWAPAWVTWSYSDRYVGWAPMPPTVTFGRSGYSGRPVVVSQTQYVFVPTDRFVGTNVMSVRVERRRNEEIFREARPATRFGVTGGVVTNVALPLATVQRATGRRVETREIGAARTTPRAASAGGVRRSGHLAIVAPAQEVRAARASRQQKAPHAAQPAQQPQRQQQRARPQQQPQRQEQARPQQQPQRQQPQPRPQQQPQRQQQPPQRPVASQGGRADRAPTARSAPPPQGREKAAPGGQQRGKDQDLGKKGEPRGGKGPR